MKTLILIAIVFITCILALHYAVPRTDTLSATITRNAESRLHSIVGALETGCLAIPEGTNENSVIEPVILTIDKDMKEQGIELFKMPIVKEEIWVSINPNIELWRHPKTNESHIAVYWIVPLRTNNEVKEYLGMTFDRKTVWLTNIPTWPPVSLKDITYKQ